MPKNATAQKSRRLLDIKGVGIYGSAILTPAWRVAVPVVSVINYKGGVGKTTVTANLAAELAWRGLRVLVLDLDSQASLTFSFIRPDEWQASYEQNGTIKAWFDSFENGRPIELASLICRPARLAGRLSSRKGEIELIPSHLGLINVDLELAADLGGANLQQTKRNFLKVHRRLRNGLSSIVDDYDVVLIDCPPNFNIVTKTAIVASDHVLVPAKPDYLSTLGIDYLIRSLSQLLDDYNEYASAILDSDDVAPRVMGVVFTMIQVRNRQPIMGQRQYVNQIRNLEDEKGIPIPVFDAWIRENKTLFGNSPEYGVPVVLTNQSPGTYGNVVKELEEFVSEFQRRLNL